MSLAANICETYGIVLRRPCVTDHDPDPLLSAAGELQRADHTYNHTPSILTPSNDPKSTATMSNQIEHSLNNIRSELGFLAQSGILNAQQYSSIMAQLPVCLLCSFLSPSLISDLLLTRALLLSQ